MSAEAFADGETLSVNPRFREVIPPLTAEERGQLEANILADGVREPIVAWRGVIVDGHNRYEIARRRGLPYMVAERDFADEGAALEWIILNQFGRRNINAAVRCELASRLEAEYARRARERQVASLKKGADAPFPSNEGNGKHNRHDNETASKIAKQAGERACVREPARKACGDKGKVQKRRSRGGG